MRRQTDREMPQHHVPFPDFGGRCSLQRGCLHANLLGPQPIVRPQFVFPQEPTSFPFTAMDLDDFDAAIAQLSLDDVEEPGVSAQSPQDAVKYIDAQWYTLVNRRGRWMDLIGDYAGSEPFVVDGTYLSMLKPIGMHIDHVW